MRLRLLALAVLVGHVALFGVFHLRSVSAAPNYMYYGATGYVDWIAEHVIPREHLLATKESPHALTHAMILAGTLAYLAVTYLLIARELLRRPTGHRLVFGLALVCGALCMASPTVLSKDMYGYTMLGRQWAVHGVNPYVTPAREVAADDHPYYEWHDWKDERAGYGPVWMGGAIWLTTVIESVRPALSSYVFCWKLIGLLSHLASGWLIWQILASWRPGAALAGSALYLLNPVCLIEFAGNGHNDVQVICLLLLGLLLHVRGRPWMAAAAISLAALTKIYALPVLLLYGIGLWREAPLWKSQVGRAIRLALVFAAFAALTYIPFWEGPRTLTFVGGNQGEKAINSLGLLLQLEVTGRLGLSEESVPAVANGIRLSAYMCVIVACFMGAWLTRSTRQSVTYAAWYAFVMMAIGAVWFWPWYVTVPLALACVADGPRPRRVAILFSLCIPVLYWVDALGPPYGNRHAWVEHVYHLRAVLAFGPALMLACWYWLSSLMKS